ncbi:L,D-transpeptidase [Afipia sp. TerB]
MRAFLGPVTAFVLFTGISAANAAVAITVNKDLQEMTVSVDGVERYRWPVSSGNPSHETPNGKFRTFRMEEDHYSKEFDDAPMPHSIFFTKLGHAIHGTDSVKSLGMPVSHGCVRLSRANATTLWDLVKKEGLLTTTVTLTGSSRVALARNPRNVATRTPATAGQPIEIAPNRSYATSDYEGTYESASPNMYQDSRRQDRMYRERAYQDRVIQQDQAHYGDQRWPGAQRRLYPDPRAPGRYIEESDAPATAYRRPQSRYYSYD